ncbi:MAG: LuxR C-terminal-related transcriptional regulator [Bacillota bacterium]
MRSALRTGPTFPSAIRSGLALGGLFGWLLSFPMFGPLLFDVAGARAPVLGLVFVVTHGASLPVIAMLPQRFVTRASLVRGAGALLALTSLLFAAAPRTALNPSAPGVIVMAILAAYLVQAWSVTFDQSDDPITTLVTAMATANILVASVWATHGLFPQVDAVGLTLIAGLAMAGASSTATVLEELPAQVVQGPAGRLPTPTVPEFSRLYLPGIAFALGAFLVGGVWYHLLSATAAPEWAWRPAVESLIYSLGIILFGHQARRDRPGMVALYSLSLLGIALMAAIGSEGELTTVYRSLFLLGLAGADLFYWHFMWRVRHVMGIRRTVGWGLWLSLTLIAVANLTSTAWPHDARPDSAFLLIGAAIIFLMTPIASREPAAGQRAGGDDASEEQGESAMEQSEKSAGQEAAAHGPGPPAPPEGLTFSERQVYDLLVKGASDAEIATALFVTRHTVKFHVRNVLHKVGVENRKELLSRLVTQQQATHDENRPPE